MRYLVSDHQANEPIQSLWKNVNGSMSLGLNFYREIRNTKQFFMRLASRNCIITLQHENQYWLFYHSLTFIASVGPFLFVNFNFMFT